MNIETNLQNTIVIRKCLLQSAIFVIGYTLLYKNTLDKNVGAEIYWKFKNILRIYQGSVSNQLQKGFNEDILFPALAEGIHAFL